jgi:hypothetical protein
MCEAQWKLICGDCLQEMQAMRDGSVDLVFGSPPYEDARLYGDLGFNLKGQDWVDWMVVRFKEMLRISKGLVAMVVEGKTKSFRWSATPALLMADLHRAGVKLRKPLSYHRIGIAGSGGPDWFRNDYEFIVCASNGKLPWSDNTAMGHPPRWAPGGAMSHRITSGARVNQWGHPIDSGATVVDEGGVVRSQGKRPSHVLVNGRDQWGGTGHRSGGEGRKKNGEFKDCDESRVVRALRDGVPPGTKLHTKNNGSEMIDQLYTPPVLANPGNCPQRMYSASEVVALLQEASDFTHHKVGGGVMGSKMAHENEAPFCESLAEWFVRSFCPPGGTVLDPFSGSATTGAVALKHGRQYLGIDCRQSQVELGERRMKEAQEKLLAALLPTS